MNTLRQSGLGYRLPLSGGDLPVCEMFIWERHSQDTQAPFGRGDSGSEG
jgi:hypothetical protein